jgi:hypothetical protein
MSGEAATPLVLSDELDPAALGSNMVYFCEPIVITDDRSIATM